MDSTGKKFLFCLVGQLGNGGTEKQLCLFLKHLDKESFEPVVIVASGSGGRWDSFIRDELGISLIYMGDVPRPLKVIKYVWYLKKFRPSVILSWSFHTNAFSLFTRKARFIGGLRGDLYVAGESMNAFLWKKCLKGDAFFTNSSRLVSQLCSEGVAKKDVKLIKNIYERKNVSGGEGREQIRKKYSIPPGSVTVAGIGRDTPEKDFAFFLDVFEKAAEMDSRLHAFIIGSAGTVLLPEIESRKLSDRISVTGEIEDAWRLLPAADIYFLSSKTEGMPNVLLEAVDAGCAVISTDVSGVEEIFEKLDDNLKSEFILRDRNIDTASRKLLNLAADENLRKNLISYANGILSEFSPEKIMPEYYGILKV